jgi:cystathionine beta-lyase/cystathionine gamma-synthase
MYGGSLSLVQSLMPRLVSAWEDAVTPATRLFLIESPSNPRLEITDIAAVAAIARERGIVTLADNTFATPVNRRPIALGVDLVWHSATKYLAGHSDTSAGVVVGPDALIETILEHVVDGRRGARPVRRLARDTRDPHAAPARRAPQHAVHPASMWRAVLTDDELVAAGLQPGLVRLACGQEEPADLIHDLDRALEALRG